MDNLFEIREDIKYRSEFERKLTDSFQIVQFYFTAEKLLVFLKRYEDYKLNKSSDRFMTGPLKGCRINREPRVKFITCNTFDEYLNWTVYKSVMPAQYQLVDTPHIHNSLSRIKKCLSNWDDIVDLYNTVKTRVKLSKDSGLELVDGEPSVITLNKLLTNEELSLIENFNEKDIPLPKLGLLPIKQFNKFHHSDAKDLKGVIVFLAIISVLGGLGIFMQSQPYTWIGAALLSVVIAIIIGSIIYNIGVVLTHGRFLNKKWLPVSIALLCGAIFFGSSYQPGCVDAEKTSVQNFYTPGTNVDIGDEETVYTTEYGECYHLTPSCPTLSRSVNLYTTTKGKAKRHYRPCSRCN